VLLAVLGGSMPLPAVEAASLPAGMTPCRSEDRNCARLAVPLDRSGGVSGTVRLRLDLGTSSLEPGEPPPDPPLLAIGGSPGQATTTALNTTSIGGMLIEEVPVGPNLVGYTRPRQLILMDLRGTGGSGPLRCDALERSGSSSSAAAACAAELGARRGFYTARDSAEDVEAVRRALGVERIALFGVEHGARVALAYAQRYPARVDRLVLQSPPAPEGNALLHRSSFASIPAVVRARCARRACRRGSKSPVADVVTLAGRLERGPIRGAIVDASGRRRSRRFDAFDLFEALGGTLASPSPTDQWGAPGQIRNARRGDAAPLLRAREMAGWYADLGVSPDASRRRFSVAAYAASVCEESDLPWPRDAALGDRQASASALAHGLPPRTFQPFGPRTALASPLIALCRSWPVASAPPDPPPVLPAIPTLIMAEEQSLVAPVAHAEAVARLIPGARVLRIPGSASEIDLEIECVGPAVRALLAGRAPPTSCRPPRDRPSAEPAPPLSLADVDPEPGTTGRAGRTLAAVRLTLRDGAAVIPARFFVRVFTAPEAGPDELVRLYGRPVHTGALRHGTYRLGFRRARFALREASYVPGVRITGSLAPFDRSSPSRSRGTLSVRGPAAARGKLVLRGHVLSGRLGGRPVRARMGQWTYPDVRFGR